MLLKGSETTGMLPTEGLELSEGSRNHRRARGLRDSHACRGASANILARWREKSKIFFFFFLLGKRKKNPVFAENLQMVLSASGNALETAP